MPKYRKVPVVIDAWQWPGTDVSDAPEWLTDHEVRASSALKPGEFKRADTHLHINTLEGVMVAAPSDWIIKGVAGEIYPCKPDIFAKTYVPETAEAAIERLVNADTLSPEQAEEAKRLLLNSPPGIVRAVDRGLPPGTQFDDAQQQEAIAAMNRGHLPNMHIDGLGEDDAIDTELLTHHGHITWLDKSEPPFVTNPVDHRYTRFRDELQTLINCHSMENGSDTPDFMLAEMLTANLRAFDALMQYRDGWYGGSHSQLKSELEEEVRRRRENSIQIGRLQAQLEAEGAHTEAANAEIERITKAAGQ